ncbi:Pr6Pr family membrane protein [Microbacterium indicum]|uniref:Pr6Pr family membrane protein n=1 Tax=Microbacterium indicum TaxID=358100 RepID=UPI0003F79E6B|nr:Pr6Pr family membrane protein [Microbacterium indicum]
MIRTWSILRLAVAALLATAVATQFAQTRADALASGWHLPTIVANFFSFFTNESNLLAAVALAAAGVWGLRRGRTEPAWIAVLLALAATSMIITGVVYNLLLRDIPVSIRWVNEVVHVVGPAFMLVDLFAAPRRRPLPWGSIWIVVAYPIAWATYTLVRADRVANQVTGDPWWYPYPFLDPHLQGGYTGVAAYVAAIAALFALVAWGVVAAGRAVSRRGRGAR